MDKQEQQDRQIYPRSEKKLLLIMSAAEKKGHLLETIIEEFARHPFSMLALWDCRKYFYKLDREDVEKYPPLLAQFALLSAMSGRLEKAREYVSCLGETPRHLRPEEFRQNDYYRLVTEMVMPYTGDVQFLRIVQGLIQAGAVPVKNLTLSACRPGILNGFRDFTVFGRFLERYKDRATDMILQLYGTAGRSVYEIMLAEWYYQNNRCFDALVLVTGTIPLIEQEKDMRCLFAALSLQMKILLMNGQTKMAKPLTEKIRDRIHKTGCKELTSSLNAMECLAACYDGNTEAIAEWLENSAPDENGEIYMMDIYAYLVKVRCYLQIGKYMVAYVLVKQLITLLTPGKRHMDLCECHMLSAMTCYRAGDKKRMCEELGTALEIAGKYHYIRLFADEGCCMVQMLTVYQEERGADDLTDRIREAAGEVGRYFPNYLKTPAESFEALTETEEAVLRLMAQGMNNDEIAARMGRKTGTVKFHSNNIFRKLQVQNRQQAVNRWREIKLL